MTFEKDISDFVNKVKGKQKLFVTELVQDMMEDIVDQTPVKTGFARASWSTGINSVTPADPQAASFGPRGGPRYAEPEAVKAENRAALLNYKTGDVVYLANTAPYIRMLEFPPYKSQQAPSGWVRQIIERAEDYANAVLQRINK